MGFPTGSDSKESVCNVGDQGSIPGLERSPGGGHGNPLQYSCLEKSMDREAWRAIVHGVTKIWLSDHHFHFLSPVPSVFPVLRKVYETEKLLKNILTQLIN